MVAKVGAGIAIAISVLFFGGETKRPEPFFTPKNVIHYSVFSYPKKGGGGECKEEINIVSVTTSGGKTHSSATLDKFNYNDWHMGFATLGYSCDSVCFYVETLNWGEDLIRDFFGEALTAGDSLRYPLMMKVGDTLPGAWATRKKKTEYSTLDSRLEFRERKVLAADTLTTPFGVVNAFRITMKLEIEDKENYKSKGLSVKKKKMDVTEWFVPEIGVVKTEFIDAAYGITRVEMQSYRK